MSIVFSVAQFREFRHDFSRRFELGDGSMARRARRGFNESNLSKGEIRKLNALRKSLGEEIANRAFAEWLSNRGDGSTQPVDRNARAISQALQSLIENGKLAIPRGGYLVRRGRGRVIIERPE